MSFFSVRIFFFFDSIFMKTFKQQLQQSQISVSLLKDSILSKQMPQILIIYSKFLLQQKLYLKMDKENNTTAQKQPLTTSNNNSQYQTPKVPSKNNKQDQLLSVLEDQISNNKGCDLLNVILADPLLKQLNISLQKQAQQQKRNKLLESFPLRYKNLVHTQILYKKVQAQMKQHQKQSKQVIQMMEKQKQELEIQLEYFKKEIDNKDNAVINMKQQLSKQLMLKDRQNEEKINEKNMVISAKDEKIADCQRKIMKVKCEKQNLVQFLEETKQQVEILKRQNQRIIQQLTQRQAEKSQLDRIIQEKQKNYQNSKQQFHEQMVKYELEFNDKVKQISRQYNDLSIANEGLKTRLRQCEDEIIQLLRDKQDNENQYFDQIQTLREQLLENVKEKNILEEQIDQMRTDSGIQIDNLRKKIVHLEGEVDKKCKEVVQKQKQYERDMLKMKEVQIKCEINEKESNKNVEEKISKLEINLFESHQTIVGLQNEKKKLISKINDLETQLKQMKQKSKSQLQNYKKGQNKNKQIDALVKQLREQLEKINEIVQQKQVKIQQSRQEMFVLRQKIKTVMIQKDALENSLTKNKQITQMTEEAKKKFYKDLEKVKARQIVLKAQLDTYYGILNRQKVDASTQVELIEGLSQFELDQFAKTNKQMEKIKEKYENAVQELQAYKKQFNFDHEESQVLIEQLQRENQTMKLEIKNKLFESSEIQTVLDVKLNELKLFYEDKIAEQHEKYRKVISLLKNQMSELYNEIDLKKSIEQEIYNDLLKIKEPIVQ